MNAIVRPSYLSNIAICILSFLLAFPLFIMAYHRLPDLKWPFQSDKILAFFVISILLFLIVRSFKFIMITSVFAITGWLWYGTVKGNYGFNEFYQDSKEVLYGMKNPTDGVVFTGTRSLTTDREIVRAIEYTNPMVRHFAVSATTEFFKKEQQVTKMKYRTLVQCFAVFKKINTTWNYVNDPNDHEYIAKASESVRLLAGDCDDHSILMAAAIKAIGGTTRLVYTKGHIYPEILAGNKRDFEFVSRMIRTRLFAEETQNKNIHFHKDENGNHWINLDYTGNYPGGKFMGEEVIECIYP